MGGDWKRGKKLIYSVKGFKEKKSLEFHLNPLELLYFSLEFLLGLVEITWIFEPPGTGIFGKIDDFM